MLITKTVAIVPMMIFFSILIKESNSFQLCPTSTPQPNSTVKFTDPRSLVSKVFGCLQEALEFQCCMTSYTLVQWFQLKNGVWQDFLNSPDRQFGDDDNQTAILKDAWDHGYDDGSYKCVGYGVSPDDNISHTLNVTLKACPHFGNWPPIPFIPNDPITRLKLRPSQNISVTCGAIFGTHCSEEFGDPYCTMNWTKISDHQEPIPEGGDNSSRRIYYENSAPGTSMNDRTSDLHIFGITESDFGTYVCSMHNKFGNTNRTIILTGRDKVIDRVLQKFVIVIFCCVFIIVLFGVITYRHKWEVIIMWNEFKQYFFGQNGIKRRNILLLHTSSTTIDQSFARYCSNKLQNSFYNVSIENDIDIGRDVISEWLKKAELSGTIIVLLSPDFLTDNDQRCLLPLRAIIRDKANIIFLLLNLGIQKRGGSCRSNLVFINRNEDLPIDMKLPADLNAAIRMKKKFEWPFVVDPRQLLEIIWESLEILHQNEARTFWETLTWCLPQPTETDPLLRPV